MKRSRWIGFLLLGCGLLAVLATCLCMDPQPYYQGRSLGTWLVLYHQANQHFPPDPEPAQALRQMGPRSLPYLVQWLSYERRPWKDKVLATLNQVPPPAHTLATNLSTRLKKEWTRRENGYRAAIWGFGVLGPAAQPAAAGLGQLALHGKGPVADRAARVLIDMDTNAAPAVPTLVNALHSTDEALVAKAIALVPLLKCTCKPALEPLTAISQHGSPTLRLAAFTALGSMGDDALPAVPTLVKASHDPQTRTEALKALMRIPSYALPTLTNRPDLSVYDERKDAIKTLASLGPLARPAIPAMLQAAATDQSLAYEVTNALRQIAPEMVPLVPQQPVFRPNPPGLGPPPRRF